MRKGNQRLSMLGMILSVISFLALASFFDGSHVALAEGEITVTVLDNGRTIIEHDGSDPDVARIFESFGYEDVVAFAPHYDGLLGASDTDILNALRAKHTVTQLKDGRPLIAEGAADGKLIALAEIYDPNTGVSTTKTSPMVKPRMNHTATLLDDGRVLVASGTQHGIVPLSSLELYDPATDAFTTCPMTLSEGRDSHAAALQRCGRVLLVGGFADGECHGATTREVEPTTKPDSEGGLGHAEFITQRRKEQ